MRLIGDGSIPIHKIAAQLEISVNTLYRKLPVTAIRQGRRCNSKPFDKALAVRMLANPDVTLRSVAERFGITTETLRKHIPAELRARPKRKEFDVAEAERLLRETSLPINEVAMRCGVSAPTLYARLPVSALRHNKPGTARG